MQAQAAEWTTRPDPENVALLRRAVRDYVRQFGIEDERVSDLTLAVSEIVANAVIHAFRDGSDGTVTVAAHACDEGMQVRVSDDGVGLSPRTDSPGAGLGLIIAGRVADRLEIERPADGGTHVCMTFARAA